MVSREKTAKKRCHHSWVLASDLKEPAESRSGRRPQKPNVNSGLDFGESIHFFLPKFDSI